MVQSVGRLDVMRCQSMVHSDDWLLTIWNLPGPIFVTMREGQLRRSQGRCSVS